jgi:hypothetical protein
VKARYQGVCRGCGAYTQPRNGKGDAYAYCERCPPGAIQPRWNRERVLHAMREWRDRHGRLPSSYHWSPTHAHRRAEMRSSGWPKATGRRQASSPSCSGRGPLPARQRPGTGWRRDAVERTPPAPRVRTDCRRRYLGSRRCCHWDSGSTSTLSASTEPRTRRPSDCLGVLPAAATQLAAGETCWAQLSARVRLRPAVRDAF